MSQPYRTLVFARLVQESPLSVGGNLPHMLVDIPLARDGQNRPVLRGSSLAGTFIATARALAGTLPKVITNGGIEAQEPGRSDLIPSSWRFAHAHPRNAQPQTAFFQHVGINERTLAAGDDTLFNIEALLPGTSWNFELEIAPAATVDFAELEALACAVLQQWQQPGGARLGRGGHHGYGWCHLEDIVIAQLQTAHVHLWPDAFAERDSDAWIAHLRSSGVPIQTLDQWRTQHAGRLSRLQPQTTRIELTGSVFVGERQDDFGRGYGLDTLSLGGHARLQPQAKQLFDKIIPPPDTAFRPEDFDPDFAVTVIADAQGQLAPYLPGASIRGVWRAHLARHLRATGQSLDLLDTLFGKIECAGTLSVADAVLEPGSDYRLLWQQHVAIDELSGGAFESAKFDRLAIADARFRWRVRIESPDPQTAQAHAQWLERMIDALGEGHLPLGGGIFRGHGHVRWTLDGSHHSNPAHGQGTEAA